MYGRRLLTHAAPHDLLVAGTGAVRRQDGRFVRLVPLHRSVLTNHRAVCDQVTSIDMSETPIPRIMDDIAVCGLQALLRLAIEIFHGGLGQIW